MIKMKHAAAAAAGLCNADRRGRDRAGPAEIRHRRHRRRHRRLLRGRRRGLPSDEQGRAKTTASAARSNRPAARCSTSTPSRPANSTSAWRSPTCSTTPPRALAQFKDGGAFADLRAVFSVHPEPFTVLARKEANVDQVRGLQGQALQRRQSRLRHARLDGRAARRAGLEAVRLLARLRAEGRRARPGAVRQQDRRLLLRRRPSVGQHPGSDHQPAAPS